MATYIDRAFDEAAASYVQDRLRGWAGGPAVGRRVPGRSDLAHSGIAGYFLWRW